MRLVIQRVLKASVEVNKEVDELMNKVVIDCMKENFVSYLERNK